MNYKARNGGTQLSMFQDLRGNVRVLPLVRGQLVNSRPTRSLHNEVLPLKEKGGWRRICPPPTVCFLLFTQSETSVHGMVFPIFREEVSYLIFPELCFFG